MTIEVRPGPAGCTLRRLWACALLLSLTVLQHGAVLAATSSEDELWQQLQSQQSTISLKGSRWTWRGDRRATLNTNVTIRGPGAIIVNTPDIIITGSGGRATLTLRDVTLFYSGRALNFGFNPVLPASSGPIPAFNGSALGLTFANVTVLAPFRTLANISTFWADEDLLAALQPQLPDGLGSAPQRLVSYSTAAGLAVQGMQLLPSDSRPAAVECFSGGVPVTDSASLRAALAREDVAAVFVYQDLALSPSDFNFSQPLNLTGNRTLELYGCPGTTVNVGYNWTRFAVQVSSGATLSIRDLTFTNSTLLNQLFWPRYLAPFLSLLYAGVGGVVSLSTTTIISPDGSDLRTYLATFLTPNTPSTSPTSSLPPAAQPLYTAPNATHATIFSWNLTGADVWPPLSPGVSPAAAAASAWRLTGVTLQTQPEGECKSSGLGQGGVADSGLKFKQLLMDEYISAIRITADIQLLASEWPPEAQNPAGGQIFVNGTKEVYACHPVPGQRYTLDFGNLGQVVFVFGTLRFRGSLLLTHPRPSPRRSWLYLLIGALSVETHGVILFDGVEIRGNTSSPFTNASDPFWNYQSSCAPYCGGFIPPPNSYLNVSYYDAFLFSYRFNKTEWVAVSQGKNITGAGFWGYTDVALTWRPDPPPPANAAAAGKKTPVAAIAVPVAVGGALLIAVLLGLVFYVRRRRRDAAAAAAAATTYRAKSDLSCSAGGGGGGGDSHLGGSGGKDGSSPPQNSSAANNPVTAVGPNSTTFSAVGTSMLSASAPTEARIEDMKRAITAHNALSGTHRNEQITLTELLGEGTFGKVYRGTWRGTTVAVKTMVLPTNMSGKEKREKMAVMETAISSSLSHPNIVQTYTYAVLPVKGDGNMEAKLGAGASLTVDSTSPLATMTSTDAQNVHSWEVRLVLEFCDRGSLRDVLNDALMVALRAKGAADAAAAVLAAEAEGGGEESDAAAAAEGGGGQQAAQPLLLPDADGAAAAAPPPPQQQGGMGPGGGGGCGGGGAAAGISREHCPLGYSDVIDCCLDVARAMLHMHSENIVHGDLKARNILLKSGGVGDGRNYVAKVADFGLSLRIDPHETHVSNVYQGTITHMAPEVLLHGKVSKMSDVYAFAILMWEAYTAGQAFKGTPRALLGHEVTKMNRRPQFPLDTPFEFQLLACRCWESDPSIRPNFEQIIGDLTRMRAKLTGEPFARPTGLGPQLSGSLATTAAVAAGGEAAAALLPGGGGGVGGAGGGVGDDSLMTASTAALPMARGAMQPQLYGIGVGGGGVPMHSVTLNSDSGMGTSALAGQGLFFVQGVDGSTMASTDGLNASPGTFTIGARPPSFGICGSGTATSSVPYSRPPPSMPPILETHSAQPPPPSPQYQQ